MELYHKDIKALQPDTPREIDERLRRRYLDRLGQRVKKLRKLLIERNWENLRSECGQLAVSGETFGFERLTLLAIGAQESIPQGKISKAATPSKAKQTAEALIATIDSILMEHTVSRV